MKKGLNTTRTTKSDRKVPHFLISGKVSQKIQKSWGGGSNLFCTKAKGIFGGLLVFYQKELPRTCSSCGLLEATDNIFPPQLLFFVCLHCVEFLHVLFVSWYGFFHHTWGLSNNGNFFPSLQFAIKKTSDTGRL